MVIPMPGGRGLRPRLVPSGVQLTEPGQLTSLTPEPRPSAGLYFSSEESVSDALGQGQQGQQGQQGGRPLDPLSCSPAAAG